MQTQPFDVLTLLPAATRTATANGAAFDSRDAAGAASFDSALVLIDAGAQTGATAVAATLTTSLTGANNDMLFTAKAAGAAGNDITITLVDPGDTATLGVVVTGTDIVVNLGYATGAITSTPVLIKAAIEATPAAHALISVANAAGNDGSGLVTALAETPLAGGSNALVANVIIQESDSSTFATGNTTAEDTSEAAISINLATETSYWRIVRRTKRYLRAVLTVTGGVSSEIPLVVKMLTLNDVRLPIQTATSVDNS